MNLSKTQKKFLKKNLKKLSLEEIARRLAISENQILEYLKSIWSKEKFEKFQTTMGTGNQAKGPVIQEKDTSSPPSSPFFDFKGWLKNNFPALLILAFMVIAVYSNSLGNEFLSDDIAGILQDKNMGNFGYYLQHHTINFFRYFFYCLIYHLFGLKPPFFRLINILFHLSSTLIVYAIILKILRKEFLAFATASLFAIHPLLTEAVTWISGGIHAQYSFFSFLSFLLYLFAKAKNWSKKYYFFSLASFFISVFTTEKSVILCLILFFYELSCGNLGQSFKKLIPYFILAGAVASLVLFGGLLGYRVNTLQSSYYQEKGLYNPLTQIPVAISHYLWLTVWPDKLTLYHSEMNFSRGQYLLMGGVTLGFLFSIIFLFANQKYRRDSFWPAFLIISLLPMLTPIKIAWIVAERYFYFGSVGIFVLIALGIDKISQVMKSQKAAYVILIILLIPLSFRTIVRNIDWKNQDNLWLAAARTSPSSPQNHNNLGDFYSRHGDFEKAAEEFKMAIALLPNYGDAYHNLANIYLQMKKIDLAVANYQKALSYNAGLWQSHQNLAAIFAQQGRLDLSVEELQEAIAINPQNPNLHVSLGIIYYDLGKKEEAIQEWQTALQIDPSNQGAQKFLQQFH